MAHWIPAIHRSIGADWYVKEKILCFVGRVDEAGVIIICFVSVGMLNFEINLTREMKRFITDYHNRLRHAVTWGTIDGQPKASNMKKLVRYIPDPFQNSSFSLY